MSPRKPLQPLSASRFWGRFLVTLWRNVSRYFLVPLLLLLLATAVLSIALLSAEDGRNVGIETFPQALYAVVLFMLTVGYRADELSGAGRIIGVVASLLGILTFGVLTSLIFYSLQD